MMIVGVLREQMVPEGAASGGMAAEGFGKEG